MVIVWSMHSTNYIFWRSSSQSLYVKKTCQKKMLQRSDMLLYQRTITYDLPLWGFLGKIEGVKTDSGKDKYFLFKHSHFNILYNDDRVIEINVQTDPNINVDISEDRELDV
ncbi:unnamed protein product [Musa acuminata subsp. burmannicoides]